MLPALPQQRGLRTQAQPARQAGYRRLDSPQRFIECAICNAAAERGPRSASPERTDSAGHAHQAPQARLQPSAATCQEVLCLLLLREQNAPVTNPSPGAVDMSHLQLPAISMASSTCKPSLPQGGAGETDASEHLRRDDVRLLDGSSGDLLDAFALLPGARSGSSPAWVHMRPAWLPSAEAAAGRAGEAAACLHFWRTPELVRGRPEGCASSPSSSGSSSDEESGCGSANPPGQQWQHMGAAEPDLHGESRPRPRLLPRTAEQIGQSPTACAWTAAHGALAVHCMVQGALWEENACPGRA